MKKSIILQQQKYTLGFIFVDLDKNEVKEYKWVI